MLPKAFQLIAPGSQLIAFAVNRLGYLVLPKAFQLIIPGSQLISFAVNRLGYLVLPKAFQKNASHSFGFFNAHRFTKASFRHRFALKKPLTFVRGFVSRSRAGSNRCRSFCRALPNHSATGPFWKAKITQRT